MSKIFTGEIPMVGYPTADAFGGVAEAAGPVRPIYLLADSQLLFWQGDGAPFIDELRRQIGSPAPRAAYLGASNGDEPAFYQIFTGAMESAGITDCRLVRSSPSAEDLAFLEGADLILLAGGDVERGWRAFASSGVREAVVRRYFSGAVLVGVSAGAVQLGRLGWPAGDPSPGALFPTFGLVPYVVDAHAEATEWGALRLVVASQGGGVRGLGIPRGGGVVYHPDHTVEVVRHPACELEMRGPEVASSLLFPVPR
ncbi:MAG TPA: Type 1 glutamine amidotransferase-like domain-containing protein [Longimicrobium sp.]|nr:Type 1 glutamine amidotransferase-like domain-containing protein [Longimicrobium sp.]